MRNRQNDELFNYFISSMDEKMQAQLRYMYLHGKMHEEYNHRREMEQMKKEIINEVKANISIWIEDEAINQLRDLLNGLGN